MLNDASSAEGLSTPNEAKYRYITLYLNAVVRAREGPRRGTRMLSLRAGAVRMGASRALLVLLLLDCLAAIIGAPRPNVWFLMAGTPPSDRCRCFITAVSTLMLSVSRWLLAAETNRSAHPGGHAQTTWTRIGNRIILRSCQL